MGSTDRLTYYKPGLEADPESAQWTHDNEGEVLMSCDRFEHNVTSSLCQDGYHRPALDIDIPMRVVASSTEGHYHLYFDETMLTWEQYQHLLEALGDAGIVEHNYVQASIARKQTLLRIKHDKETPCPTGPQ